MSGTRRCTAGLATLLIGASLAAPAGADPGELPQPGSAPADVITAELGQMGYTVVVNWTNGTYGAALSRCRVTDLHGPGAGATIYLDVVCHDGD